MLDSAASYLIQPMALSPEKLQNRAIKAGIRASKKRHHVVSKEELLKLKIQVLPSSLRGFLLLSGAAMILGAVIGWPFPADGHQVLMGIGGGLLVIFGVFGVRRSLETFVDGLSSASDAADVLGIIIEAIGSAFDG